MTRKIDELKSNLRTAQFEVNHFEREIKRLHSTCTHDWSEPSNWEHSYDEMGCSEKARRRTCKKCDYLNFDFGSGFVE